MWPVKTIVIITVCLLSAELVGCLSVFVKPIWLLALALMLCALVAILSVWLLL